MFILKANNIRDLTAVGKTLSRVLICSELLDGGKRSLSIFPSGRESGFQLLATLLDFRHHLHLRVLGQNRDELILLSDEILESDYGCVDILRKTGSRRSQ